MEQFQINESRLVHAPAFHARPVEETSPSLPASSFLSEQKQRPRPERGSSFKFVTEGGGGRGVRTLSSMCCSANGRTGIPKHRALRPPRRSGDQRNRNG